MGKANKSSNESDVDHGGRIGRLDEQTLGYYRRVSDQLNEGFDSSEDKDVFLKNVFEQLGEEAIKISQNQTASTIVESLVKECGSSELLQNLLEVFSKEWETVCCDRFATHVLQSLLLRKAELYSNGETSAENDSLRNAIEDLHRFVYQNLAVHMQHTYTSHIVRVLLEVVGGVRVPPNLVRSRAAHMTNKDKIEKSAHKVPEDHFRDTTLLNSLCEKIISFQKLEDHAMNYLSSPVIQTMLHVLKLQDPEQCKKCCEIILKSLAPHLEPQKDSVGRVLAHEVGSHLIEQILVTAPPSIHAALREQHLEGQLMQLALHPTANFIIQRLVATTTDKSQFESIFSELSHHIEDLLGTNRFGVIAQLAEGCITHGTKQDKLVKHLLKAFHCYDPVERQIKCVPLIASHTTYEVFYKVQTKDKGSDSDSDEDSNDEEDKEVGIQKLKEVNIHGSLLLQKLLKFSNPRLVISSLLDMRREEIIVLACNPRGTHIIEAFLTSPSVGEKSRDALYKKIKGQYVEVACHRSGSRTLDALCSAATLKNKILLAEELVKHEPKLGGNQYGRFVSRNLGLRHFAQRPNEWKEVQQGQVKKRKLFKDIISDQQPGGKPKKQKTEVDDTSHLTLQMSDEETADGQSAAAIEQLFSKAKQVHKHSIEGSQGREPSQEEKRKQKKMKKKREKQTLKAEGSGSEDSSEKISAVPEEPCNKHLKKKSKKKQKNK